MSSQEKSARPKIQLPSFREVHAAQKTKVAPSFFESSAAKATGTSAGASNGASAVPPIQPPAATAANPQPLGPHPHPPPRPAMHPTPVPMPGPSNQVPAAATPAMPRPSTAVPGRLQAGDPGLSGSAIAGPSSRAAAGPPSTSYAPAPATRGGLVEYQAHNASPNAILVSKRQDGNPLLRHVRNVRWVFADIVPDYIIGADSCALFLSMRFHLLKPEYIYHRIKELQRSFRLRVLLCHVDIDDVVEPLQQITRAALLNDVTLVCAWSPEECARYLETYKVYETKPADAIQGRTEEDYLSRLNAAFTTVRGVNKTDVLTLGSTFDTAARTMQASMEELSACPGIGPTKVKRLYDTFHQPFRRSIAPTADQPNAAGQLLPAAAASGSAAAASGAPAVASQSLPMEYLLAEDGSSDGEDII